MQLKYTTYMYVHLFLTYIFYFGHIIIHGPIENRQNWYFSTVRTYYALWLCLHKISYEWRKFA